MPLVLISELAESCIVEAAVGAHPTEVGGILVGVMAGLSPWIAHALVIPPETPQPNHYLIPAGVTQPLVDCVRRVDRRLGYLGDWHVHPADVGPSRTDLKTMRRIARVTPAPILVVARKTTFGYDLSVVQWRSVGPAPRRLVRTGALEGPAPPTAPTSGGVGSRVARR